MNDSESELLYLNGANPIPDNLEEPTYAQSERITELITSLCKAKLDYGSVVIKNQDTRKKTAAAAKSANNGYGYEYADLAAVNVMTTAFLAVHGLTIVNMPYCKNDEWIMLSRLYHVSGQWLQGEIKMILTQTTSQGLGDAITYARRYLKLCLLDIAPTDDDDGLTALQDEIGELALKRIMQKDKKDKKGLEHGSTQNS